MNGIKAFLDGRDILRLLTVGHHLFVQVALRATVNVLQIGSQKYAEAFLPETVTDGDTSIKIGQWHAVTGDL